MVSCRSWKIDDKKPKDSFCNSPGASVRFEPSWKPGQVVGLLGFCLSHFGSSLFAVGIMIAAGLFGYIIRKLGFSVAPLVIGFVLGVIFEDGFRQSITTSQGSIIEFFNTPIGLTIYGLLFLTLFGAPLWRRMKSLMKRDAS